MESAPSRIASWTLWGSVIGICFLTFVWPFVISDDPALPAFKVAAIAVLLAFLPSMMVLLAVRIGQRH